MPISSGVTAGGRYFTAVGITIIFTGSIGGGVVGIIMRGGWYHY